MTDSDTDHGITVTEISPMDQPVRWRNTSTAAFIGRALRGPLDTPVLVESISAFTRRFGGRWRRGSLFDAVEQFFLHGGQRLYVVRVANDATGATLELPGPQGALRLRALDPGTSEILRVAIDYDGIVDDAKFNLAIQRLSPESRLVIDQEIFSSISCDPAGVDFVGEVLMNSRLVEMCASPPSARPYATMGHAADARAPYILAATRGSDGAELCDYDLVGSAQRGTGLFSLEAVEELDIVYLPPRSSQHDAGPAALLAAEVYCRRRGAMLVMDPAAAWPDAQAAVSGVENFGLASAHTVTYFPRLIAAGIEQPAGAAIAGLLCKLDALRGPWGNIALEGYAFSRGSRPSRDITEAEQHLLLRHGINPISAGLDGRLTLAGGVTLACDGQINVINSSLATKRFTLKIARCVERATRWAVFEQDRALAAGLVERQVEELLHELGQRGAIRAAFVRCETHHDTPQLNSERGLAVMLVLQTRTDPQPISLTLYQTASGCRVASTAFAPVDDLRDVGSDAA